MNEKNKPGSVGIEDPQLMILVGMAIQAAATALLTAMGQITPSPMQQGLVAVACIVIAVVIYTRKHPW